MCFKTSGITNDKENFKENIKNIIKQYYQNQYVTKVVNANFNTSTIVALIKHCNGWGFINRFVSYSIIYHIIYHFIYHILYHIPSFDTKSEYIKFIENDKSKICFIDPVLGKLVPDLFDPEEFKETTNDEHETLYINISKNVIKGYCSTKANFMSDESEFLVEEFLGMLRKNFLNQRIKHERFWFEGEEFGSTITFKKRKNNDTNRYGVKVSAEDSSSDYDENDFDSYYENDGDEVLPPPPPGLCQEYAEEDNDEEGTKKSKRTSKSKSKSKSKKKGEMMVTDSEVTLYTSYLIKIQIFLNI